MALPFSKEKRDTIAAELLAGKTYLELARKYNVTLGSINIVAKSYGLKIPREQKGIVVAPVSLLDEWDQVTSGLRKYFKKRGG